MEQQMTREELAQRLATLREAIRVSERRVARLDLELALRLSELRVRQATRLLRSAR